MDYRGWLIEKDFTSGFSRQGGWANGVERKTLRGYTATSPDPCDCGAFGCAPVRTKTQAEARTWIDLLIARPRPHCTKPR